MIYRVCTTFGNLHDLEPMLNFYEIDDALDFTRSIEIGADGRVLKYTTDYAADAYGQLPEGKWDEKEASLPEYGATMAIDAEVFETAWQHMLCYNMSR